MVIDDDPLIINSIKKQLKKCENYFIDYTSNPIEALEIIDNKHYDIILCDIKM
jgi:CheY-like chemotaxis protein